MRYRMGDTEQLTHVLLSGFTEMPHVAVEMALQRYLWRHLRFHYAEQLDDALDDVRSGAVGDFVYHKQSHLIFAHVEYGHHRLLLAHLCALHKTDFSQEQVEWSVYRLGFIDPLRLLADEFILKGYGLFRSSCSNAARATVGQAFKWEPLELAAFGNLELDLISA